MKTPKEMKTGAWLSICWAGLITLGISLRGGEQIRPEEIESIRDFGRWAVGPLGDWRLLIGGLVVIWAWALQRVGNIGRLAIIATAVWVGIVVLLTVVPLSETRGVKRPLLAWEPSYVFEGDAWTVLMVGVAMIWAVAVGSAWIRTGK